MICNIVKLFLYVSLKVIKLKFFVVAYACKSFNFILTFTTLVVVNYCCIVFHPHWKHREITCIKQNSRYRSLEGAKIGCPYFVTLCQVQTDDILFCAVVFACEFNGKLGQNQNFMKGKQATRFLPIHIKRDFLSCEC